MEKIKEITISLHCGSSSDIVLDQMQMLEELKNDYDILIATDAISEGFNLHRAGTIFNYDIPYNPTRVVQRFGRINRINKKVFNELYIFNYFPTEIGEREVGISRFELSLFASKASGIIYLLIYRRYYTQRPCCYSFGVCCICI